MDQNPMPSLKLIDRTLYLNGNAEPIDLSPMEARLMATLLRYPNQTVSRATIMHEVWQTDYLEDTRTLDVHIRWLRRKVESNPSRPRRIITVRGVGYRLHI
ncbi:MAG TPA: helix-turn-helix domain-containing protein [Anaerolineae bacterium]|nr:winged helix-turn-helix domain-containing protein [Anaerolineae bacterium]MCB0180288.1 winged helix-turn-helix domain-containing protein [Anaerolineae bacterium]MCB0223673.1 winged helix-turn-helix domain-containing protein [Anaerolineae bacterium]MCB9106315.1 winged helix-turn-helix domain-containing protein [Anaerolineales bacterium]HRV94822.1 helix-turn-helix domain-containing protein [Anaerolineae bacterium]